MNKKVGIFAIILFLSGCQQTTKEDLKNEIESAKQSAVGYIPEPPQIVERKAYKYSSSGLKSPFRNSISEIRTEKKTLTEIKPDLNRTKSELESFELQNFYMTGTIKLSKDDSNQAIVNNGRGKTYIVSVGDYMGKNNGKILDITTTSIKLEEIIPNGAYRWVKRPSEIKLIGE